MSRIQKAFVDLVDAIHDETISYVEQVREAVEPVVNQVVAQTTAAIVAGRFNFEELMKHINEKREAPTATEEAVVPDADPIPTAEQNAAIQALRSLNKSDEEIAAAIGVSVLTVKMAS
jgi:RES domain-containing protein